MVEIGADSQLRIGRDLREERERRNVSLEQVAKVTRFSMRHIQSLEADLFDELPSGVVIRKGLIRSYCQLLGLDEDLWLHRFAQSGALAETEPDLAQFAENVHRARLEAMPPVRRRWWGVVVMIVGLLALAFAAWHYVIRPRLGIRHRDAPPQQPRQLPPGPGRNPSPVPA